MPTRKVIRTKSAPAGLSYVPDFLSEREESALLEQLKDLDFKEYVYQGYTAKRKVKHFGFKYEFYTAAVAPTDPFPDWLQVVRDRAASIADYAPQSFDQALIAYYPTGAAIGWHRDAPAFGETVLGVSLLTDEVMRFRREHETGFEMFKQPVARRSLYVMSGPARSQWQHSLAAAKSDRYSITFRMVRPTFAPVGKHIDHDAARVVVDR